MRDNLINNNKSGITRKLECESLVKNNKKSMSYFNQYSLKQKNIINLLI
ncbi:MAG: hypothetical protein GWN56_03130 [Nitrosopumilaceae archaeon]|nr:hypothetical protein [Nitrosopumilaceae archaeon]NIV65066.1 hypothetical protein [Nitrosopumilaceae archaeon]